MPTAICNDCSSLIFWKNQKGNSLKKQRCQCGSQNLTLVSANVDFDNRRVIYNDRKGNVKKIIPMGVQNFK